MLFFYMFGISIHGANLSIYGIIWHCLVEPTLLISAI